MITQSYYVATGRQNAMYTLRCVRFAPNAPVFADPDFYICNLSASADKALEKAIQYVGALRERIGEHSEFKIEFDGMLAVADKRRGTLSIADTRKIETIEAGVFPFGKHAGQKIVDAPDSYVLYFADKAKEGGLDAVMQALSAACTGVALEQGLIAKRDQARAERMGKDALSEFVGTIGDRLEFSGKVVVSLSKVTQFGEPYWINKIRCGTNLVTYIGGKSLGKVDETVTFKATVKNHELYNGTRSTVVARPRLI